MLLELSKVEQRYDAVVAVIRDGMKVTEVAEKFGVQPPDTVYRLARRAMRQAGLEALATARTDRRPRHCRCERRIEARVLELRRLHPHWGPASIRHQLSRDGVEPLPSMSGDLSGARRATG